MALDRDVHGYADKLTGEDRVILTVKPGITGPASIHFKNEEDLLEKQQDPLAYNDTVIWPEKVIINKAYIKNYSLFKDIKYIIKTVT
ncbi:sugar transferase [Lacinutrix neustonica]|uniref:Sugar transferase n=1 Tax=Lacinutrix neustonica TaxID=2980107 RepID=A0A9E8MTK6_9FLAO|nr:sugar transferase [Lacinutrix neustonica]WAC01091.1 sugar transferase [Lacinutrix neustonica]